MLLEGLTDLTVVCGPNDSGKTTVLESIVEDATRSVGSIAASLTERVSEKLFRSVATGTNAVASSRTRGTLEGWREAVSIVAQRKPIWHAHELHEIALLILKFAKQGTKPFQFEPAKVTEVLGEYLPPKVPSLLIPAKRQMDTASQLTGESPLMPSGSGVLQKLASLKNARRDSEEHGRFAAMSDAFKMITGGYAFDIVLEHGLNVSLHFSRDTNRWFHAKDCGLGLSDVLLILYFSTLGGYPILAIEEPENHLHPDMQRRLLHFIHTLKGRNVFLSTHSNVFLSGALARILVTKYDGKQVSALDATSRAQVLSDLGYSVAENLLADIVVLVEGPTDVPVVDELLRPLLPNPELNIRIWPLGGDIMAQVDLTVMTSAYRVFALVDSDPGSERVRRKFCENCTTHSIPVTRLQRRAIENYFSLEALKAEFPNKISEELTTLDPQVPVVDQLGFSPKRQNRSVVRRMKFADVSETDLGAFLLSVKEASMDLALKRGQETTGALTG